MVAATLAVSWFRYYLLLWWIVAYRYLDVGPRRLLQSLYDVPTYVPQRWEIGVVVAFNVAHPGHLAK